MSNKKPSILDIMVEDSQGDLFYNVNNRIEIKSGILALIEILTDSGIIDGSVYLKVKNEISIRLHTSVRDDLKNQL